MGLPNVDITKPVAVKDLSVYGAGAGDFGVFKQGMAVFAIATAAITANAVAYVTPDGKASATSATGSLTGVAACNAAAGEGVWVVVLGNTGSAFVAPSVAS